MREGILISYKVDKGKKLWLYQLIEPYGYPPVKGTDTDNQINWMRER